MKLHHLEIENFNSLYGTHEIAFDRDLPNAPLFLIMGATGAGKTTILDAICVTLFGTTPRVHDEDNRSSLSRPGERMMSLGTGFCRAMLEFSLVDDQGIRQRYRAEWRCERAYKKPDGNVKDPERSLLRQQNGHWDHEPLASGSRRKDYRSAFKDIFQEMNADSFLRSVMLAQGKFSAFLKANEKEKAIILEMLTDTDEYKRVGNRAGVVKTAKKKRVDDINKLLEGLPEVDKDSLARQKDDLKKAQEQEKTKKAALEKARKKADWIIACEKLGKEHEQAAERAKKAAKNREDTAAEFEKLELARRARRVEKSLSEVDRLRSEQKKLREEEPELKKSVQAAEEELKKRKKDLESASATLKSANKSYDGQSKEIKEARKLRLLLKEAKKTLEQARKEQGKLTEKLQKYTKAIKVAQTASEEAKKAYEPAKKHLTKLLNDAPDVSTRRRRLEKSRDLLQKRETAARDARRLAGERINVERQLLKARTESKDLAETLEELPDKKKQAEKLVDARTDVVEAASEAFDHIRQALALSNERQALKEDDPCPLCGSEDHPYLTGGTHEQADQELNEKRDTLEARLSEAKQELKQAKESLTELNTAEKVADEKNKGLREKVNEFTEKLESLKRDYDEAVDKADVKPADDTDLVDALDDAINLLDVERKKLTDTAEELDEADEILREASEALTGAKTDLKLATERVTETTERVTESKAALSKQAAVVEELNEEVGEVLDGSDPDDVEKELKKVIDDAKIAHKKAQSASSEMSTKAKLATQNLETARKRLEKLTESIEAAQNILQEKLAEEKFTTVDELRQALLAEDQFSQLRQKVDDIKKELDLAKERLDATSKALEEHKKESPEDFDRDAADIEKLKVRVQELDAEHSTVNQLVGKLKADLATLDEQLKRRRNLYEQRSRFQEDLKVWNRLYKLIGVRHGAVFQEYAQALNLRELIHRANAHLENLAPRYSLAVAEENGRPKLDFTVCDAHHANEERALSTLSGGETFLVSLAMALALADYHRVDLPMETLLLDEGFGTLDQDTLSTAISLLKNLHLDGDRQVGLISHVEGLKERIPHQIRVQTLGGGKSTIEVVTPSTPDTPEPLPAAGE